MNLIEYSFEIYFIGLDLMVTVGNDHGWIIE